MTQPLAEFPALHRLIIHEPWLADPAVRAQCLWEDTGWDGHRYAFFVMRDGRDDTLGALLREGTLHYCRLYPTDAIATRDSQAWANEIKLKPEPNLPFYGGVDQKRRTWSVRVVQRQRGWEVHMTNGGLIPTIRDFVEQEDAEYAADEWLTNLHLGGN
jgi:hypothetical protein